jgi:hypothetical protein
MPQQKATFCPLSSRVSESGTCAGSIGLPMIGQRAFTNWELCVVLAVAAVMEWLPLSPFPLLQPTAPPKNTRPKTAAPIIPTAISVRLFIVHSARFPSKPAAITIRDV